MKKVLLVVTVLAMLVSAFAICAGAEDTIGIDYGDKQLQIKLVETFDGSTVSPSQHGECEIVDGDVIMTAERAMSCVDRYGITTDMLTAAGTLNGAKYLVFSMTNESDGDIWFCFQPQVPDHGNVYMGGEMGLNLYLVGKDGTVTVINAPAADPSMNNARYGYGIPEGFDGYLFMPSAILCDLNNWTTSVFTNDDPTFLSVGFNVYGNQADHFRLIIHDMYIYTQDMPEYAPKPAETTNDDPVEPATQETHPQTGDMTVSMFAVIAILTLGAAVVVTKKKISGFEN